MIRNFSAILLFLHVVFFPISFASATEVDQLSRSIDKIIQQSSTQTPLAENMEFLVDDEPGSNAEFLFMYAMGKKATNACITCDFISYFMSSLTKFSELVYTFFEKAFPMLAPLMLLIWIAWRVSITGTRGGGDGSRLLKDLISKFAFFTMVFLIMTTGGSKWIWKTAGPEFLNYALSASLSLTEATFNMSDLVTLDGTATIPYSCDSVQTAVTNGTLGTTYDYYEKGLQITCITERTHIIGIATGVAVVMTTFNHNAAGDHGFLYTVLNGCVKVFAGLLIMTVYILSCIWLIFLILDIIVEVLIVAAFSPIMAIACLWKPSRSFFINGLKTNAGALVTALSISMVSVLSYYLLANIVEIYNVMYSAVSSSFDGVNMTAITGSTTFDKLHEFIKRTQETNVGNPQIPMNLSTPWFVYICLTGISIYALGKKLMAMITQIIGIGGQSSLANSALGLAKTGAMTGMKVGTAGVAIAASTAGIALGGAGFATGLASPVVGSGLSKVGSGISSMGSSIANMKNPFVRSGGNTGNNAGNQGS